MQIKFGQLDPQHEVKHAASDLQPRCEQAASAAQDQRLADLIDELEEARATETERAAVALHQALQNFRARLLAE